MQEDIQQVSGLLGGVGLNFDPALLAALNKHDFNSDYFDPETTNIGTINGMPFASVLSEAHASYEGVPSELQSFKYAAVGDKGDIQSFDLGQTNYPGSGAYYNNGGHLQAQIIPNESTISGAHIPAHRPVEQTGQWDVPQAFDPMSNVRQAVVYKPWCAQNMQPLEATCNLPNPTAQKPQQTHASVEMWAPSFDFEPYETHCPVQQAQMQSQGNMISSPEAGRAEGFLFDSLEEAIAAHPSPAWRCPTNDPTIPSTDQDRGSWVIQLLSAMSNTIDVFDSPGVAFTKRWYHPVTGPSTYYSEEAKEIVCWDIVDLAEQLHRIGLKVLHSFDKLFWDETNKTQAWTFQQRMQHIVLLLEYSKGRCESLLANETLHAVVGYPSALLSAANNNAKCNRGRQAILEAGRVAKKVKMER
ncbi:hypothetical protein PtrSN002B_003750 [Pyrenophora tritici-repentis]|uniref:Uncharacterized protein n=2 Tax=Pyrenophora tritici-repentis TaxID=45151 RepID=A0A2W1HDW9_9PLEO|nr:uncharacterized protein PTRG_10298 [Pyrenophora tritici-repentis Pt-1C-BFP]KAA8620907.1 hypothetical protein PtrV1_05408 [Pyrenophora tritici-repentis]EDU43349.1 conserved hypothetical protein [Pyrenophora tritici-repentis Pt-1C-BFP]KAF7450152.1 hypothetical protein A1F99_047680 [Pyrenophora tritici-repentis]KAF7572722.1 hypothetical protein PtrM4_076270 [Pyrenophora tritici-repentis]KAG9376124.1 hypothetical protein A1F94_013390 [Pyrenophora tritici-repentis]